jgi:hypothetical protein
MSIKLVTVVDILTVTLQSELFALFSIYGYHLTVLRHWHVAGLCKWQIRSDTVALNDVGCGHVLLQRWPT